MRGTVAKKIRKKVYGDFVFRDREYTISTDTGMVRADSVRDYYQQAKKQYNKEKGM